MTQPGSERRQDRRQERRRIRDGDTFTIDEDEAGDVELEEPDATAEPADAAQVLDEEETGGDYA